MTKGTKAQQARAAENGQHDLASEDAEQLKHYYYQMLLLRVFEERTSEMYTKAKIGGYCHLNLGEEATIVGLMAALTPDDYIFTNYREHGYVIARGVEPGPVIRTFRSGLRQMSTWWNPPSSSWVDDTCWPSCGATGPTNSPWKAVRTMAGSRGRNPSRLS